MTILSADAERVLDRGVLCHVAAMTASGPHVTPLVFAVAGDRIWVTTSRSSSKARAWRRDDRVAGLVRDDEAAVTFGGRAICHDALEPTTWLRSVFEAPVLALASARFTRKNARFFAGYAVDANHVPLAWTPPGRVFAELRIDRWALLDRGTVRASWGDWPAPASPASADPASPIASLSAPFARLPDDVAEAVGAGGDGALALEAPAGPVVLPARWRSSTVGVRVSAPASAVELAGLGRGDVRAALEVDRVAAWRARDMTGAMVRGWARLGAGSADGVVAAPLRAARVVWWRGWQSGTVAA